MSLADGMAWESEHGWMSGPERACGKCKTTFPLGHIHVCTAFLTGPPKPTPLQAEGYDELASVLSRAFDQAARGKGKERHANDEPFTDQPMMKISKLVGSPDGLIYQAIKKTIESQKLPTVERQVAELLGAINYLAGCIIFIEGNANADR